MLVPSSGLDRTKPGVIGAPTPGLAFSASSDSSSTNAENLTCRPATPLTEASLPASVLMSYFVAAASARTADPATSAAALAIARASKAQSSRFIDTPHRRLTACDSRGKPRGSALDAGRAGTVRCRSIAICASLSPERRQTDGARTANAAEPLGLVKVSISQGGGTRSRARQAGRASPSRSTSRDRAVPLCLLARAGATRRRT